MGIAEIAMIASIVLSLYGSLKNHIIDENKYPRSLSANEASNLLRSVIYKARNLNADKASQLENKLASLSFIRRTPALRKAIKNAQTEFNEQRRELQKDDVRLQQIQDADDLNLSAAESREDNVNQINTAYDKYDKQNIKLRNEAKEILKKYEQ